MKRLVGLFLLSSTLVSASENVEDMNDIDKGAYAIGTSVGTLLLESTVKAGSSELLDKEMIFKGIEDGLNNQSVMDKDEVELVVMNFNKRVHRVDSRLTNLEDACNALNDIGITTRPLKKQDYDNKYHCNSDYYDVDSDTKNGFGLSNNIAYYVTGNDSVNWSELKVVVNINTPSNLDEAQTMFRNAIVLITSKLAPNDVKAQNAEFLIKDENFYSDVREGKYSSVSDWFDIGYHTKLVVDDWPSSGFEYRFTIER